ncbi:hypothetical protein HDE_02608 [Halotydeus destructor]|nr:hypothetical protein HDE_02608 [Halotydeus destructor]
MTDEFESESVEKVKNMEGSNGDLHVPTLLANSSPRLKTFGGDGVNRFDVDDWLKEYEAAGEGAADEIKLRKLPTFLKGSAKDWFDVFIVDHVPKLEYKEVVGKMKSFFNAENDALALRCLLSTNKQRDDQIVADYITAQLKLCKRVNEKMDESEKILHIIAGLKPNLQQAMFANNPSTVEQLLTLARQHERGFKATEAMEPRSSRPEPTADLKDFP